MSTCRSCKAEILWVVTPQGRRMPLDAAPVTSVSLWGTWVVEDGKARPARDADAGPRYVAHFATCPDSAAWRNG